MLFSPRCFEERARRGAGPASTLAGCDLGVPVPSEPPPSPLLQGGGPVLLASQDCGQNQARAEPAAPCSPGQETALPADPLLWGDNGEQQRLLVPRLPVTPKPLQAFAAGDKNKTADIGHSGGVGSGVWLRGQEGWPGSRSQPSGPLRATQRALPGKVPSGAGGERFLLTHGL